MIHDEGIKEFSGDPTYYDYTDEKVESIINQQYGYFGYEKYPTI